MSISFHQTSRLLKTVLQEEAKRCVKIHGSGGKGDEMGSQMISACTAEYVATCVVRELTANPANEHAQSLRDHFLSVLN